MSSDFPTDFQLWNNGKYVEEQWSGWRPVIKVKFEAAFHKNPGWLGISSNS